MQDLNWDDLRIFLALARKAKLPHAARATGVDATTISRRIARLEAALGVRLFELSPQGHVLTSHGSALLPAAETAERGALIGLNSITGSNAGLGGLVGVSICEVFGTRVVARQHQQFSKAHHDKAVQTSTPTRN